MSRTERWIDWRGLSDPREAERHYPDLVRVGSLARLLDDELARIGSALRSSSAIHGFDSWSYAEVTRAKREASIYIAKRSRDFRLAVSEHGIVMAGGSTSELSDVAAAIPLVLENSTRKISKLVREIPFLKFKRHARKYERGTYVEKRWREMLTTDRYLGRAGNEIFHWDDLAELIKLAAERPELRRLLPYTSLHRFSVTPKAQLPDNSIPIIWPLGNRRYALTSDLEMDRAEGSASVVLDALVEHVASLENPRWPAG